MLLDKNKTVRFNLLKLLDRTLLNLLSERATSIRIRERDTVFLITSQLRQHYIIIIYGINFRFLVKWVIRMVHNSYQKLRNYGG